MAGTGRHAGGVRRVRRGAAVGAGVAGLLLADAAIALARARRAPSARVVERGSGRAVPEPRPPAEEVQIALAWGTVTGARVLCRTPWFLRYLEARSVRAGEQMDLPASAEQIDDFLEGYGIDVADLDRDPHDFTTINELFSRPMRPGARPVEAPDDPGVAVVPADCRITCVDGVGPDHLLVKGRRRRVGDLLGLGAAPPGPGADRVRDFHDSAAPAGFSAAVCRLAPADYHRFHWPVDGRWEPDDVVQLAGEYHSVAPVCVGSAVDVLGRNRRTVVVVGTEAFGDVAVVVVGAVKVGSIELTAEAGAVRKGAEMGRFRYGGSTVVVLFRRDAIELDPELVANSARGVETLVRVGSRLGVARPSA